MKHAIKYLSRLALWGFVIYSCIPIDDVIPPNIDAFSLEENSIYFYKDTISFDVVYTDNVLLDSGVIQISKAPEEVPTENDWDTTIVLNQLQGRRLERVYSVKVPEYKSPGRYIVSITVFDRDGNQNVQTRSFFVQQDQTFPVFSNVTLGLSQRADGAFEACRSTIVPISGLVTDNLSVNRLGFALSSGQQDAVAVLGDSLELSEFFGSSVLIPSDVVNGTALTLTIFAIDTFQNRVEQDFIINIACDDVLPEIVFVQATPELNTENFTNVAQGGRFSIDSVLVSDNEFLKEATVFFNSQGEALSELYTVSLNTTSAVDLADSVNLVFEIPDDAPIGQTRDISFIVTDSVGNSSPLTVVSYSVVEDLPPLVLITNTYIDLQERSWDINQPTTVQPGVSISFDGKVEELNALSNVVVEWGPEGNQQVVANITEFNSLPYNLAFIFEDVTLRIPNNAEGLYRLTISATDTRQQSSEAVTYQFFVSEN